MAGVPESGLAVFAKEVAQIAEDLGEGAVETRGGDACRVIARATPYRTFTLDMQVLPSYPNTAVTLFLSSPTLPPGVVKRTRKDLEGLVRCGPRLPPPRPLLLAQAADHAARGSPHALAVANMVADRAARNKLLYCAREIRKAVAIVGSDGWVRVKEEEGLIRVRAEQGRYYLMFVLTVPDLYPAEAPSITFGKSSFPDKLVRIFRTHAEDIISRCAGGMHGEQAVSATRQAGVTSLSSAASGAADALPDFKLTASHMRSLKHDVRYLKQAADLRRVNEERRAGDHGQFANDTSTRKQARRDLRKLTKAEAANEEQQFREAQLLAAAEEGAAALAGGEDEGPCGSVLPVVEYLVESFVRGVPREACQACGKRLFPADPEAAAALLRTADEAKRATRIYCGHWFHYACLARFITEPPFGKPCPTCGKTVQHPDWPSDVKKLEKRWAHTQAKKREVDEVKDLLGI